MPGMSGFEFVAHTRAEEREATRDAGYPRYVSRVAGTKKKAGKLRYTRTTL